MAALKQRFDTLWFKIMFAFALVLLLMLLIFSMLTTSLTQRSFQAYLLDRGVIIESTLPFILTELPANPPIPDIPELPEIPAIPTVPPIPEFRAGETIAVAPPEELAALEGELDTLQGEVEALVAEAEALQLERLMTLASLAEAIAPTETEAVSVQFLRDMRQGIGITAVSTFIVAIILATVLTRQITRPLTQIRHSTQQLASGDFTTRVPVRPNDELGKVAASFNQMAVQLERQEQLRRQIVADVAHELRTPLTVMKSNLEAMQDGLLEPSPSSLGELQGEVDRLSHMIDDLRLLSLGDSGQLKLQLEPIQLQSLLETVIGRYAPLAETKAIKLTTQLSPVALIIDGDRHKLEQAIGNLLDNAIRYTPENGSVAVALSQDKNRAHITVSDSGPGIPSADLPHVFDRFWRGDKSRSRDSGGTGLGLSIVKQIVEQHGGTVRVSSVGDGAVFMVSLVV